MADEKKDLLDRVKIREPEINDDLANEYILTAKDRLVLRGGFAKYDERLDSIVVEVVLAMYRRKYHEGISSEGVDVMSTSFVNDLLDEYTDEIASLKHMLLTEEDTESSAGRLRFL